MSTLQRQIRDAFATRIQGALPGAQFFRAPHRELNKAELPAACLFGRQDRAVNGDEDDHQCRHERCYTVRVELLVAERGDGDATDEMAAAVRAAVLSDDSLSNLVSRITWAEQAWDGSEGEFPLSGTYLDFNVFYLWSPE